MLSKEEKNAIEFFEECIKKDHLFEEDLTLYFMKIVLNLITKLKKENEHWKNGFERELEDNRKNTCELLNQDLIIRQKDKQIDLMADFIDKTGAGRRAFLCVFRKNDECDENGCRNCIKQYFEKLAKEKGE